MRLAAPTEVPEAAQRTLDLLPPLTLFGLLAHAPTALDPWLGLGGTLLTALDLDPVLRELTVLQVASGTGCAYEHRQHEGIALGAGASPAQVLAVTQGRLDDPSLTSYVVALRVVAELVDTHGCQESSMTRLHAQLGARHVVELLLVVGFYLGLAVLINAVDLAPEHPDALAVLGLPEAGPAA